MYWKWSLCPSYKIIQSLTLLINNQLYNKMGLLGKTLKGRSARPGGLTQKKKTSKYVKSPKRNKSSISWKNWQRWKKIYFDRKLKASTKLSISIRKNCLHTVEKSCVSPRPKNFVTKSTYIHKIIKENSTLKSPSFKCSIKLRRGQQSISNRHKESPHSHRHSLRGFTFFIRVQNSRIHGLM